MSERLSDRELCEAVAVTYRRSPLLYAKFLAELKERLRWTLAKRIDAGARWRCAHGKIVRRDSDVELPGRVMGSGYMMHDERGYGLCGDGGGVDLELIEDPRLDALRIEMDKLR